MALSGSIDVVMKNGNTVSRTAANQIANYRDASKTIIHKVNRNLDQTYFVNRLQFTELANDKIRIKAKISPGQNRQDDMTVEADINGVMDCIFNELDDHTIFNVKIEVAN